MKLDAKEAYYHIRLDEASSKTDRDGRYMWKRLPFGLSFSEMFHRNSAR